MMLEELPDEILVTIFCNKYLLAEDLLSLTLVSKRFHNVCGYQILWKSKFKERWPWTWKKIHSEFFTNNVLNDWKKETIAAFTISIELDKILNSLSHNLYKHKNITSPVFAPIQNLFNVGLYGFLHILNNLQIIFFNKRDNDLTRKYYAKLVLYQVNQCLCKWEFEQFFKLKPERQSLEKGAFYFSKWFQPEEFLNIDFQEISSKFDDFAFDVQCHLRKKYRHHPATTIQLISPEKPLENTNWSEEECEQLFECINYILFSKHNFRGNDDYYVIQNNLINKVIETKMGIPVTLSIVYQAVCHRLGIILHPVNCPSHFLLKWKVPMSNRMEFIDAYGRGNKLLEGSAALNNLTSFDFSDCESSIIAVLMRMTNNTLYAGQRNMRGFDLDTDMLSAAGITLLLEPNNTDILEFVYRLYLSFEIHVDKVISGCEKLLKDKSTSKKRFENLLKEAKILLGIQETGPKPIVCKNRPESIPVKFTTGMVMQHKLYGYTCVIYGWDEICKMPMEWINRMNVFALEYQNNQPFYNVLVSDGSHRYAAQENLIIMEEPVPVTHYEIGKYFNEFNGFYYVANEELRSEYPDDDDVKTEVWKKIALENLQNIIVGAP